MLAFIDVSSLQNSMLVHVCSIIYHADLPHLYAKGTTMVSAYMLHDLI